MTSLKPTENYDLKEKLIKKNIIFLEDEYIKEVNTYELD